MSQSTYLTYIYTIKYDTSYVYHGLPNISYNILINQYGDMFIVVVIKQ
jgi:hypothetical protein